MYYEECWINFELNWISLPLYPLPPFSLLPLCSSSSKFESSTHLLTLIYLLVSCISPSLSIYLCFPLVFMSNGLIIFFSPSFSHYYRSPFLSHPSFLSRQHFSPDALSLILSPFLALSPFFSFHLPSSQLFSDAHLEVWPISAECQHNISLPWRLLSWWGFTPLEQGFKGTLSYL